MQKEATQKLLGGKGHQTALAAVSVVLPAERHFTVAKGNQPVIGNGDAVRVARQIVQYMLGAPERRLGVDNPVLAEKCAQKRVKCFSSFQGLQRTGQTEIPFLKCLLQPGDELAAENPAENLHRKKEGVPWVNPTFVIRRQT